MVLVGPDARGGRQGGVDPEPGAAEVSALPSHVGQGALGEGPGQGGFPGVGLGAEKRLEATISLLASV